VSSATASQTRPAHSAASGAAPAARRNRSPPLAALEADPDRELVAEDGAQPGGERAVRAGEPDAEQHRRRALGRVRRQRRRRQPLRPVRSTLVAPMLPEPIWRISPSPARRVSTQAERNGTQQVAQHAKRNQEDHAPKHRAARLSRCQHAPFPAHARQRGYSAPLPQHSASPPGPLGVEQAEIGQRAPGQGARRAAQQPCRGTGSAGRPRCEAEPAAVHLRERYRQQAVTRPLPRRRPGRRAGACRRRRAADGRWPPHRWASARGRHRDPVGLGAQRRDSLA